MSARLLPYRRPSSRSDAAVRRIEKDIAWRVRLFRVKRWVDEHAWGLAMTLGVALVLLLLWGLE